MVLKNGTKALKKYRLDPFAYYVYTGIIIIIGIVLYLQYLVTTPLIQSPEYLPWYRRFLYFDYMFLLFTSVTAVLAGLFMMYVNFGGGKRIGAVFVAAGILVFVLGFYYFDQLFPRPIYNPSNVYQALVSVLGTILGFFAAIAVAFVVVVKVGSKIKKPSGGDRNRRKRIEDPVG